MDPTPLIRAAQRGDVVEVRHLLSAGADPNEGAPPYFNALNVAAASGHTPIVELLLSAGAKATYYALESAAMGNHAKTVRVLLRAGADFRPEGDALPLLNQLRYSGFTREQQKQVRQLLHDAGARELPDSFLQGWLIKFKEMRYLKAIVNGVATGLGVVLFWIGMGFLRLFVQMAHAGSGGIGAVSGGIPFGLLFLLGFVLGCALSLRHSQRTA